MIRQRLDYWPILTVAAMLAVVVAGCTPSKTKTVPVNGSVRYLKTQIPEGALVVFHPTEAAREKAIGGKPFGKVGADGSFTLTTFAAGDGAPEGDYGITVEWRPKVEAKLSLSSEGGPVAPSKLQPRFSDPRVPFKTVTVKAGADNTFSLDVE